MQGLLVVEVQHPGLPSRNHDHAARRRWYRAGPGTVLTFEAPSGAPMRALGGELPGWVAFEAAGADSRQSASESGLTSGVRTQGRTWRPSQFETVPTGMGIPFLEALDEACRQMMNYTSVLGRLSNVVV